MTDVTAMQSAVRTQMLFEATKKSATVAYILWIFLGGFGAHRFYSKRGGGWQLALLLGGAVLTVAVVGFFILAALCVWVLVDAFFIPGMVTEYNVRLADQLTE